jgi:hypothetical protein
VEAELADFVSAGRYDLAKMTMACVTGRGHPVIGRCR